MSEGAARFNTSKVKLHFNLPLVDEFKARVSEYGSVKYDSWNWTKGGNLSTPFNSLSRHLRGLQRGEWLDPESKLPHCAHISWNGDQMVQWYYTAGIVPAPVGTGVMVWDLPVFEYRDQLEKDLLEAAEALELARERFQEAKRKAGLLT